MVAVSVATWVVAAVVVAGVVEEEPLVEAAEGDLVGYLSQAEFYWPKEVVDLEITDWM